MNYLLKFAVIIILLNACNTYKTKYPYSLADFKPELRVHLEKIVSNPFIYYSNNETSLNYLDKNTSDNELQKLLKAEHSILRALAFKYLSARKSVNITKILLDNLDDTATISNFEGALENTVADFMIDESRGKTNILKASLIDTVITKHPYLIHAAIFFIRELAVDEKYYPELKKIIKNKYSWHYNLREELIAQLSEYKKNEDTSEIATWLKRRWFKKEEFKFTLIENNPSNAYFFAIEKYYNNLIQYNEEKILQEMFWRNEGFEAPFTNFIYAAASYKSKESAAILQGIYDKKLYKLSASWDKCEYYDLNFQYTLYEAISKYKCPYYKNLFTLIEDETKKFRKRYILPPMEVSIDTFKEKNTW